MRPIQMVDLKNQYENSREEINAAIQACLNSTAFINGPQVQAFKKSLGDYLGVQQVVPCANGTDALQIAMMALGLEPGDEVIVPDFTYVATAEVIALLGLTPVIIDVDPQTFNITAPLVEAAITSRTKAIVPVHLFGQCVDMEPLLALARQHSLSVIEDNAQAIGAAYTFSDGTALRAGTMGEVGCTSFFPSKNLGCYGDGGAMYTNDDALANQMRRIANHGQSQKYYHDVVGVNSRLDSLQAAILNVKLPQLDAYNTARQKAAAFYDQAFQGLEGVQIPYRHPRSTHVFHQYTLQVADDRDALKAYLERQGIPTMIYYPVPLHRQKAYSSDRYRGVSFPVTERLCETVLSLPMHTALDLDQMAYIADHVKIFLTQKKQYA